MAPRLVEHRIADAVYHVRTFLRDFDIPLHLTQLSTVQQQRAAANAESRLHGLSSRGGGKGFACSFYRRHFEAIKERGLAPQSQNVVDDLESR